MAYFLKILCLLLFFSTVSSQSISIQRHNGNVILVCNAKSHDNDKSYEWYMDNDRLVESDEYHEIHGNKLIVEKYKDNTGHFYKCVIELRTIGAKYAVTKKIEYNFDSKLYRNKRQHKSGGLQFATKMMPNKNFELGATGKIHCKATGSKNIYWKKNEDEDLPKGVEDSNGTLIFNNVDASVKGIYKCYATSDDDQISHQIEVRILPTFEVIPPEQLTVNEQQSVFLNCMGSGLPTIKWDYETKIITTNERFQIHDNGSLFLQYARVDDSGRYGCTIGNSAGFKRAETLLLVKSLEPSKEDEELEEASNLLSNKAVLITCSLAIVYIICVIVLMIWCRQRRSHKNQSDSDPEHLKLNDENEQNDDKASPMHETLVNSLSSSYTFDIRYEKIHDMKKIGLDGNFKMDLLTGYVGDSDLPTKIISKENFVTDEIRMQQQTKVLLRTIKRDQDENSLNEFRRLVDLYCNVESENVVKLLGLSKEPKLYGLVLEHSSDDLKTHLTEKIDISTLELLKYCRQIANGINAIHSAKLIHRDISLNNCIITKENVIKLTSKTPTDSSDHAEYNGFWLLLRHTAPEIILNCNKNSKSLNYSYASDIYAFGMTLYEIFNKGNQPFKSIGKDELLKKLQSKSLDYESIGTSMPSYVNEIMIKCLKFEAPDRIVSSDLINSLEDAITK